MVMVITASFRHEGAFAEMLLFMRDLTPSSQRRREGKERGLKEGGGWKGGGWKGGGGVDFQSTPIRDLETLQLRTQSLTCKKKPRLDRIT